MQVMVVCVCVVGLERNIYIQVYIRSRHIGPNIYHQDVVCRKLLSVIFTVSEVNVRQYLLHPEHSSTHSCSREMRCSIRIILAYTNPVLLIVRQRGTQAFSQPYRVPWLQ